MVVSDDGAYMRYDDAQRALDAEREKVTQLEQQLESANALIYKNNCALGRAEMCINDLQAQLARWKEALGEWLWNCTNLLGDYHIKTVQDFNEEVNRRIAWLMQHLDHTLPPPMTDEERDRMRKLSEDNAALQADNECKDSLIETLQAQLPAEMPGCTILFKECEKGHGRLTATNWIDHGCGTCTLEQLQAQLAELRDGCEMMTHTAGTFQELWRGACDQREAMEAQLRQVEGERNTARHRVDELEAREIDVEILQGDLTTLRQLVKAFTKTTKGKLTLNRYEHGGGRMFVDDGKNRDLIADTYNEGDREFITLCYEVCAVLAAQDAGKENTNGL